MKENSEKPRKKRRISLTKNQLQSAIGTELLALCQSITEDGSISDEEINGLKSWLTANKESDLPSIEFLTSTVNKILADGKMIPEEANEIYEAIESILPVQARRHAKDFRKEVEAEEKAHARQHREALKQQDKRERQIKKPIKSADFMVAGVYYEGRQELIEAYVENDDQVFLARDRDNSHSSNAIEIRLKNGVQIGFVPEIHATELAPLLDQGCAHHAYVKTILIGGRGLIPVIVARIYRPGYSAEGVVYEADIPAKGIGCSTLCLSLMGVFLGIIFLLCWLG